MDDLLSMGKIHYIAVSDSPAYIVSRGNAIAELRGWSEFIAYQFPYNFAFRTPEREIIPFCRQFDITMTPWSVLGAGLWTGKYSKRKEFSGRLTEGKWRNPSEESLARAGELDRIANDIGHSPAQIATNWIRQQADAMIPIFGATNVD